MLSTTINNIIHDILLYSNSILERFVYTIPVYNILISLLVIVLLLFIVNRFLVKRSNVIKSKLHIANSLMTDIQPNQGMEKNLNAILDLIQTLIGAPAYAFYIYDNKNNQYLLKTVKHPQGGQGDIAPSYSGLAPYNKETYLPPPSLSVTDLSTSTEVIKEGAVPLVVIPIKSAKGFVRIGPIRKLKSNTKKMLNYLSEMLDPVLLSIIENDNMKNQIETIVTSGRAVQKVSNIFADYRGTLDIILGICIKATSASGGLFLSKKSQDAIKLLSVIGMEKEMEEMFTSDEKTFLLLNDLVKNQSIVTIKNGEENYANLPQYFAAYELDTLFLVNADPVANNGVAVFWYQSTPSFDEYRVTAMMMMAKRMGDIIDNHRQFEQISHSYIDMLKMLANMLDSLNPYTIGYSVQMARYAISIARELNLNDQEVRDISIAAYLSNVGVLGLSNDLFQKEGKYSELEYEIMKLHSEVGASIVESTISKHNLASYIRYHHEREDGLGYPSGLKGNEIPIGAKIISVVQTFLAKINGRKDRDPLPFDKAINVLSSATGTQLDSDIVDAFVRWLRKKQTNTACVNKSLGPCWEMRCSPESICGQCPAYRNASKNCWEFESNNCKAHGNHCDTCFVHTEYLTRPR